MAGFLRGVSKIVASAAKFVFDDAVLIRTEVAAPVAGQRFLDSVPATPVRFRCKAIRSEWNSTLVRDGMVSRDDVRILILAATLKTTPRSGDQIELNGLTVTIAAAATAGRKAVMTDPATAAWDVRASA